MQTAGNNFSRVDESVIISLLVMVIGVLLIALGFLAFEYTPMADVASTSVMFIGALAASLALARLAN
jgi:hypothetical protein